LASYHLTAKIVKRSAGRSVVAAAAYRSASRLTDERSGQVHDYSRKRGVAHAEVMTPTGVPAWMKDRQKLWERVEASEKRRDAQLAREVEISLPHELTDEQRLDLVRGFVTENFVSRGMVADFAIHSPVRERGDDPRNHHAHILLSLRKATAQGFHRTKTREWNSAELLKTWRTDFADRQNRALGRFGHAARVDHRSLAIQREEAERNGDRGRAAMLDRVAEIHVGPRAMKAVYNGRHPKSRDRTSGPVRRADGMRPGEWKRTTERVYLDDGAGEGNWLKRQFADRKTVEGREYQDRVRRVVRYTVIDHGTRLEANLRRLEQNCDRWAKQLARLQQKAARFRNRRHWLTQQEHEWQQYARRLQWEKEQNEKRRLWKKKQDEAALYRAMFRAEHVKKRRVLAELLIGQVDGLLAGLLGIRERQLGRAHGQRRARAAVRERPQGQSRSRARRRSGPTSAKPYNT
jgi:hypothetical protein